MVVGLLGVHFIASIYMKPLADDIHAVNHAGAIQQRPRPAFLCHQSERGHRQLAAGQFGIKHTGKRDVFLTHTEKLKGIPFTDTGICTG